MKITETIKFLFYPLFFSKTVEHKTTIQEIQTLLPQFAHRKIHLICEGNEKTKRECYYEIEEIFFSENLEY
jgi:hypothetical protein